VYFAGRAFPQPKRERGFAPWQRLARAWEGEQGSFRWIVVDL
jgi:hypothetical protein